MAEISLRAYIKEIDDLIEHDQLDEAIAHCRHTLEVYPKLLATYRLLGKAYLEAKRYGDAADVFQRVLSAAPDDFVAQIGMAIVREDEGNLDSAIWHMERAFETNPANPAIQQELRRLIGNRDGIEPSKVRMTRAALARMYAHGELYPQAIAELKAALTEDPDRPDMQVLLAMLLWRSEQFVEAAEVSSLILEKLPYCRDANRIMAAILQESGKTDDASNYHRRLAALDPYAAFIETASIDPQTVDSNTVRMDKLEWRPGQPMPAAEPGQPEWASSLGVKLGDDEPEAEAPIPRSSSWLEELEKSAKPTGPEPGPPPMEPEEAEEPVPTPEQEKEAVEEQPVASASEIPNWMRDAGWVESTGEAQEQPISFSDEELAALDAGQIASEEPPSVEGEEEGELAPAQIPGWMQEIAPSETPEEGAEPQASLPDWIGDIAADIEEVRPDPGEGAPPEEALSLEDIVEDFEFPELIDEDQSEEVIDTGSIPAWLDTDEPGATSTIITWLGKRSPEDLAEDERRKEEARRRVRSEMPIVPPIEEDDQPPAPVGEEVVEAPPTAEEGAPSWLAGVAEVAAQQAEEVYSAEDLQPTEQPEESREPVPEVELGPQEDFPPAEQPEHALDAPDWLLNIAADEGSEPAAPPSEERLDRLQGVTEEQRVPAETPTTEEATAADWLQSMSEIGTAEPLEAEAEAEDWLADVGERAEEPAQELQPVAAEPPDLLAETGDAAEELTADQIPAPVEPAAWLEGIVEDGVAQPTEPSQAPPDWLRGIGEEDEIDISPEELFPAARAPDWLQGIAEPSELPPAETLQPDLEVPDWLDGVSEPERPAPDRFETEDETMDWLRDITDEQEFPEPEVEELFPAIPPEPAAAIASEALDDEEIFDWLQDLADRQAATEDVVPAPIQEAEDQVSEEIISDAALPEAPEESLEWLESLASQRGIDHDVGIQPETPERPFEEPAVEETQPEKISEEELGQEASTWLDRMATQPLREAYVTPEGEPEPQVDIRAPDWLREVAGETELPLPAEVAPDVELEPETAIEELAPTEEGPELAPEGITPVEPPMAEEPVEDMEALEMKIPDWLQATIESAPETREVEPAKPEEVEPSVETVEPDLEREIQPEIEAAVPEQAVQPIEEPGPTPTAEADEEIPTPLTAEEPDAIVEVAPEETAIAPELEAEIPTEAPMPAPDDRMIEMEAPTVEPQPVDEELTVETELKPPEPELAPEAIPPLEDEMQPETAAPVVEDEGIAPTPPTETTAVPAAETEPPTVDVQTAPVPGPPEPEAAPVPAEQTPEVAPEPAPAEAAPKKVKAAKFDPAETLEMARQALASDDVPHAVKHYSQLIKRKKELDQVIDDLRLALDRDEDMPTVWQILGDAYMKDDQLQEAIAAYKRGTEVA